MLEVVVIKNVHISYKIEGFDVGTTRYVPYNIIVSDFGSQIAILGAVMTTTWHKLLRNFYGHYTYLKWHEQ